MAEGWLRPGYFADPPQFDPRRGESLSTPSFEAKCFQAPSAREKIDVVIPLSAGSRHGDAELRYALRSMCRHFEDLGRVWVIGHRPAWLRGVEHIPARDDHSSKDINIIRKLEPACGPCAAKQACGHFDSLRKANLVTAERERAHGPWRYGLPEGPVERQFAVSFAAIFGRTDARRREDRPSSSGSPTR